MIETRITRRFSECAAQNRPALVTFVTAGDPAPAATDVVMIDLDSDGALDAVVSTSEGAVWLAR